jgi:hypothetical protein
MQLVLVIMISVNFFPTTLISIDTKLSSEIFFQDFGVETLSSLIKETNFPWLLSNVTDSLTKQPLAGSLEKVIIDFNGIKVRFGEGGGFIVVNYQ